MTLKVLVVDDATFVRDMIKRTVRQLVPNVELLEASDGARAQGIIKSKQPDLILSDWEMPEMSGLELLAWCREHMAVYKVPAVVEFVDSLPKSGAGKVMWRALQEREKAR